MFTLYGSSWFTRRMHVGALDNRHVIRILRKQQSSLSSMQYGRQMKFKVQCPMDLARSYKIGDRLHCTGFDRHLSSILTTDKLLPAYEHSIIFDSKCHTYCTDRRDHHCTSSTPGSRLKYVCMSSQSASIMIGTKHIPTTTFRSFDNTLQIHPWTNNTPSSSSTTRFSTITN